MLNQIDELYNEAKEKWGQEFKEQIVLDDDEEKLIDAISRKTEIIFELEQKIISLKELKFKVEVIKNKTYADLYNYYLLESDIKYSTREIDKIIKANDNYISVISREEKLNIMISQIEAYLTYIKNIHWDIKNMIEIKKMLYGASV